MASTENLTNLSCDKIPTKNDPG